MGHVFHPPQFTQLFNILLTIGVAIAFSYAGIFDYSALNHLDVLLKVLIYTGFLTCFILVLKCFIIFYDREEDIGIRSRCRRDYLIGCGGIILLSFIQFFVISYPQINYEIRFTAFFTFNITSIVLYFTFIWNVEKLYKVDYTWKLSLFVASCYVVLFLIARRFIVEQSGAINMCHYVYIVAGTVDTTTFLELLQRRIHRIQVENNGEELEGRSFEVENSEGKSDSWWRTSRLEEEENENRISWITVDETNREGDTHTQLNDVECDKCLMKFDEKIARTLLKHNNSHYFICPFCQQVTVVHESPTNLTAEC